MSKSLGNAITPLELQDKYGHDAFRYFLLRDMTFGLDASFHEAGIAERTNADLANDLGNLLHRTLGMLGRFTDGVVPEFGELAEPDVDLRDAFLALPDQVTRRFDELQYDRALEDVMVAVRRANKYVADQQPWALAKDPAQAGRLGTVLRSVVEALRVASVLLEPVMPNKARELRGQLGLADEPARLDDARRWDGVPAGTVTRPGEPLFPRVDLEALAAAMAEPGEAPLQHKDEVTIDDFARLELRVALVTHAEPHPRADKLVVLTVELGPESRTIVAGIREHYPPAELIGKKVVIVANLKPVKLRGVTSQGMVLAAEDAAGRLALIGLDRDLPDGSEVR